MLSSDFHHGQLLMFDPFTEFSTLNLSIKTTHLIIFTISSTIATIPDAAAQQSAMFPSFFLCNAEVKPQQPANHLLRQLDRGEHTRQGIEIFYPLKFFWDKPCHLDAKKLEDLNIL